MTKDDQFLARVGKLVNVGLTAGSAFAFSVFLNFFYHYTWTGQRQFSRTIDFALYYVFPLALAFVLLASTKLKPLHKLNLIMVCVTAAASVYAVELLLESRYSPFSGIRSTMTILSTAGDKKKFAADLTKKFGVEIDIRTPREVIEDLRKKGVDAVPITTPSNHLFVRQADGSVKSALNIDGREVMPLAGVSNKVTLMCNESGQWIDYRSDEHGFNNSNELWHSGRVEIAALGDSYTQGYCVSAGKSFVALIGQSYPAILNLGVAGDGPLLMLAKLDEYLRLFKPKTVLWFYYEGNDLANLQTERKSALLRNYLNDGFTQSDLSRQSDIDRAIMDETARQTVSERDAEERQRGNAFIVKLVDYLKLSVLRQRLGLLGGIDFNEAEMRRDLDGPDMDVFRNIMTQAKTQVEGWGGQLYFIYLPEWARYADYASVGKEKRDEVLSLVRGMGLPVVDIDLAFQAQGDPLSLFPFREVGHYNELGHRVVAEAVRRTLPPRLQGQ